MDYRELIQEKRDSIAKLQDEIVDLEHMRLQEKTGIEPGDLVQNSKGEKGIAAYGDSTWCWYWHKFKKDGTPSERDAC